MRVFKVHIADDGVDCDDIVDTLAAEGIEAVRVTDVTREQADGFLEEIIRQVDGPEVESIAMSEAMVTIALVNGERLRWLLVRETMDEWMPQLKAAVAEASSMR